MANATTPAIQINEGNVGIGTTSPAYKLDVEGDIRAKENIRVFGNSVTLLPYNSPTETSVNLGTYINDYAYIDLASTNAGGGWLDFSKGNGTDYAGRIRYVNVSDQFQISTAGSQKMVITSAGSVGIGTSSPAVRLDFGSATGKAFHLYTSGTDYYGFNMLQYDSGPFSTNIFAGNGGDIKLRTASGTSTQSTRLTVRAGGNVGIGTTSPASKLHVQGGFIGVTTGQKIGWIYNPGTDNTMYNYILTADNGGVPASPLEISGSRWTSGNTRGIIFTHQTGGEIMTIMTGGNVGIGTTSPSEKLEVAGKGLFTGTELKVENASDPSIQVSDTDVNYKGAMRWLSSNNVLEFYTRYGGTYYTSNLVLDRGNVGIGTTTPNAKLDIQGTQGQLFSVTDDLSGDIFSVADISGVPIMNVNSDGTSYFDGNVGIGTDSPGAKLDVEGGDIKVTYNSGYNLQLSDSGGTGKIFANGDSSSLVFGATVALGSTATERMRIVGTTGNVGIGTTSPASKLHVFGGSANTELKVTTNDNYIARLGLYEEQPGNLHGGFIQYRGESGDRLEIGSRNSGTDTVHMSIDDTTGYVGIGTTAPGAKLDVTAGASSVWMKLTNANESSFNLTTYNNGTSNGTSAYAFKHGLYYNSTENTAVTFYRGGSSVGGFLTFTTNNGAERMRIDSAGNVGIGTTSPSAKLDVNGDIIISDSGDRVFATDSLNGAFELGDIDALSDEAVIQGDGAFIFLKNAGNTTLTTTVDNRVGIGTSSPGSKLDIVGATNESNSSLLRVRTTDNPNAPEKVVGFYVNTNTERGFISVNQYSTAYSTSSDYRLKENIVPISNSIERLKELKPCRFNFTQGDPNYVVDGFIAHEAAEVIPEAVTGEKDAIDEDNNPLYQGIDQSKVVPLLTAALQEAISKIEQLETRIQTLENN